MFLRKSGMFLLMIALLLLVGPAAAEQPTFELTAKSALLMEYETGEIIFEKNPQLKLPPASMTKIMTMLLVMEAIDQGRASLEDKIIVSELAASMGGSQIWLEPGEEMTLEEMMKAIAIVSANDASVAVAEYLYGTEEDFVKRMNERARELGCENTYFYNTNGLPPDDPSTQGNYTSAYDLAIMARELLKYPQVLEWTSTWIDYLRDGASVLNNTNRLVRHYQGADGLKTGYTQEAKYCVTSTATRNGIRFIAVIMGAESSEERFNEAAQLLSYGFSTYQGYQVAKKNEEIGHLAIRNAREEMVRGVAEEDIIVPIPKGKEDELKEEIVWFTKLKAPLKKGDQLGEIKVYRGNLLLKKVPIIAEQEVTKASFWQLIIRFIQNIIRSILKIFT